MPPITRCRARLVAAAAALIAGPGAAQDLPLPDGAVPTAEDREAEARYALPTGAWTPDGVPVRVIEGPLTARAWRLPGSGLTPQQIVRPIRDALVARDWTVQLDCAGPRCGGFDFRYATRVLPGPAMYVDLTGYRFVSAIGPDGGGLSLLASHDGADGYLQVIHVGPGTPPAAPSAALPDDAAPTDLIERLLSRGHVILPGLDYASGAAALAPGPQPALDRLAAWLQANPGRTLAIVGHTDITGTLAANRALSKRRAQAVRAYLTDRHGVDSGRLTAYGAGYLAPIASNLTAAGRTANRRVEAVLLPE